jgi:hypothetical protein
VKDVVRKTVERITDPQLQAIMERGRFIPRAPDVVRARLLARARAAIVALDETPAPVAVRVASSRGQRLRFALAAGFVSALVSAGAAGAFHAWSSRAAGLEAPVAMLDPPAAPAPAARLSTVASALAPAAPPAADPTIQRASRARAISPVESYAAELRLLQRAQSDYAAHDFSGALGLVAKHAHRFPNGRLTEEREALRVRSLAGAGHSKEARVAFATFARRFPRSVLLSRLQQVGSAAED